CARGTIYFGNYVGYFDVW
nr:immunoglobulin heavy chain junction region [Mus musculus]